MILQIASSVNVFVLNINPNTSMKQIILMFEFQDIHKIYHMLLHYYGKTLQRSLKPKLLGDFCVLI